MRLREKIHATGYCLGGLLLSIVTGCRGEDRIASVTLLATQIDFSEPGQLALFTGHSQMHSLGVQSRHLVDRI